MSSVCASHSRCHRTTTSRPSGGSVTAGRAAGFTTCMYVSLILQHLEQTRTTVTVTVIYVFYISNFQVSKNTQLPGNCTICASPQFT